MGLMASVFISLALHGHVDYLEVVNKINSCEFHSLHLECFFLLDYLCPVMCSSLVSCPHLMGIFSSFALGLGVINF